MALLIRDYDDLKNHTLKLREGAAGQAKTAVDPASRSFANGLVYAYDQIFVALLAWEQYSKDHCDQ